ncbi:hypothetical protein DFP72DRAFT_848030 [Ephemerocybe angulata]|uniref:Uncharacterized protein n=1 Tax=Ephemerocybe angulata TaxID=980116 RepID=A0A8H6M4Q9_9AGAR|nr:hypothetical protein DFP72DRAFT_848030 [Tulosesus angulatus]
MIWVAVEHKSSKPVSLAIKLDMEQSERGYKISISSSAQNAKHRNFAESLAREVAYGSSSHLYGFPPLLGNQNYLFDGAPTPSFWGRDQGPTSANQPGGLRRF